MEFKRYKPLVDKLFYMILIPTVIFLSVPTVTSFAVPAALIICLFVDLVTVYFIISPLYGYVELREESIYIKFGFLLKKEIPYSKIRGVSRERKWYSDSMMSLKNAFDHVNIKYNRFDVVTVSVVDNDGLERELLRRLSGG